MAGKTMGWRSALAEAFRFSNTPAELAGYRNGISLFFGALLGANLGTVGDVPLRDYIWLIALLASVVMTIQIIGTTHSRVYALVTAATMAALLCGLHALGKLDFTGLSAAEGQQLVATIIVWLTAVLATKFMRVREDVGSSGPQHLAAMDE